MANMTSIRKALQFDLIIMRNHIPLSAQIAYWACLVGQINPKPRRKYWATHSFAYSAPLASFARSAELTRSLACSFCALPRSWDSD